MRFTLAVQPLWVVAALLFLTLLSPASFGQETPEHHQFMNGLSIEDRALLEGSSLIEDGHFRSLTQKELDRREALERAYNDAVMAGRGRSTFFNVSFRVMETGGGLEEIVYIVPSGYDPSKPHTLMVVWHGCNTSCHGPHMRYCQKLCMKIFTERIPLAFITPRF